MDFSVWCVGWARPVDRSKTDFYHFMWSNVANRKSLTSLTDCTKNVYGATHSSRGIGMGPRTLNCLKTIDQRLLTRCNAFEDLVPFVQFKKRENTHGGVFLLGNDTPWVFSCFLNCTNGTQSRKASHIVYCSVTAPLHSQSLTKQPNLRKKPGVRNYFLIASDRSDCMDQKSEKESVKLLR